MLKRTLTAALLGLAVASHAVLAQDMTSPARPAASRNAVPEQQKSDQQKQAEQKRLDEYWASHNDDAPGYPLNP